MRTLHLLRHAKSSWDDPHHPDIDRPLTERGRHDAQALGDYLRRSSVRPGLVLCSPAVRTRQTLDLVAPGLGLPIRVRVDESIYAASADTLWREVLALSDDIDEAIVVAHNPGLHELALELAHGGEHKQAARLRKKLPTGAFVTIAWPAHTWASLAQSEGELINYVRPRDLPDST